MGTPFLLQDWTTVRGATSTNWVMPATEAIDLHHFKDLLIFTDVADFNNVSAFFQTSPTRDENLFVDLGGGPVSSAGVSTAKLLYDTSNPPVARFVRWAARPTSAGSWSVTVRIWVVGNMSGNARKARPDHKHALDAHLQMHADNAKKAQEAAAAED